MKESGIMSDPKFSALMSNIEKVAKSIDKQKKMLMIF